MLTKPQQKLLDRLPLVFILKEDPTKNTSPTIVVGKDGQEFALKQGEARALASLCRNGAVRHQLNSLGCVYLRTI